MITVNKKIEPAIGLKFYLGRFDYPNNGHAHYYGFAEIIDMTEDKKYIKIRTKIAYGGIKTFWVKLTDIECRFRSRI